MFIIIGFSKVNASPDNPDCGADSRPTLWGTSDSANNAICVYICEILDGFMLIWNILHVGLSVFA